MRFFLLSVIFIFVVGLSMPLFAQDSFGFSDDFGFSDSSGFGFDSPGSGGISINLGGNISAELTAFIDDFSSHNNLINANLGDIFSANLNLDISGSAAQAYFSFNLRPVFDRTISPFSIDEAYVRAFFGSFTFEGGIRKLSWGRADSFSPLDLINPLDFRDLSRLQGIGDIKIAIPLIRGIWNFPSSFSRLEAVFVPGFKAHEFSMGNRWTPNQITSLPTMVGGYFANNFPLPPSEIARIQDAMTGWVYSQALINSYPNTSTLRYSQFGLRYSSTLGSSDYGIQYYFGRMQRPAFLLGIGPGFYTDPSTPLNLSEVSALIDYNYFHHIGFDYARVIQSFNIRAEAGANITRDLNGTDGRVENPSLLWSLGFDRDLFAGINLNIQGTGSFRLFQNNVGPSPLVDIEAGTRRTSTRLSFLLSRSFSMDEIELKLTGLWGIEDRDFLFMPAISWTRNDLSTELSMGFFGGNRSGELGQYRDNSYIRILLRYNF